MNNPGYIDELFRPDLVYTSGALAFNLAGQLYFYAIKMPIFSSKLFAQIARAGRKTGKVSGSDKEGEK
jgi:hypothetical protein